MYLQNMLLHPAYGSVRRHLRLLPCLDIKSDYLDAPSVVRCLQILRHYSAVDAERFAALVLLLILLVLVETCHQAQSVKEGEADQPLEDPIAPHWVISQRNP